MCENIQVQIQTSEETIFLKKNLNALFIIPWLPILYPQIGESEITSR